MQWSYLLHTLTDVLMPERASARLVREATPAKLLAYLNPAPVNGVIALLPYQEPLVRAVITETKFHHNDRAAKLLAHVVSEYLATLASLPEIVLPIPLSATRQRERGYNQVTTVLTYVPNLPVQPHILIKIRHTTAQTKLNRAKRLQNLQGAFALKEPTPLRDKSVCIIDDVLTTGTTLQAAAAVVADAAPRELTLLAFAH